jgi:PAS domain S-box-containing protein
MSVRAIPLQTKAPALSLDDSRLFIESVADYAILMLDPEGFVATWNLGAERTKGYRTDEIVGQHFSVFYPREDVEAGKPARELATAREVGRLEDEGWRVRKDGSLFWANVVITALRNELGELRGFAKVTRDLTQRRAEEERLRTAEERFHLLVDAVTDYAIFMLDPGGHVATWNVGARSLKGYEESEIVGKHFSSFYTAEDRASGKPERLLDTVRREGRSEDESWRVRKDGTRFWANVVITALRNAQGKLLGFAKVTRDLTVRRQAEETERRLLREQAGREVAESMASKAEEANRMKDEFLATLSHELRTPLNAIVGWAAMLARTHHDPKTAKAIDVISRNAHAQVKMIEDILDVSRIINGKLRIEPKPTDLVAIANDAIEVVRPSATAKRITIELESSSDVTLFVGDPERLQQVVWNLLSNAVKFTEAGGSIRIGIRKDSSNLVLVVGDTGKGIDADFLPFVFDRFKQADSSTTRRYGGLGLGLALVRHIVELHGGTVAVESPGPGQGSTFRVVLPIYALAAERARKRATLPTPEPRSAEPESSLEGFRVLVVDDDEDARELITAVLEGAGASTEASDSVPGAFIALRRFRPHVLVSDIAMPQEDGYAFIKRLRAMDPAEGGGIPSIALTAYTRNEDRAKALAAGFTTHIGKPVVPADLLAAVANLAMLTRR